MQENNKKFLIFDLEANGLKPTEIFCVVTLDWQTNEERVWTSNTGFREYISGYTLVGHNLLWYDLPVLNQLWDCGIDPVDHVDTLVVSRLLNSWDYNQHSLAAWGVRLGGEQKVSHDDWSKYSPEMLERCKSDVRLTKEVFDFEKKYIDDTRLSKAMEIEHHAQIICTEMHYNGFGFDIEGCSALYSKIASELETVGKSIQESFPPRQVLSRTILPRPTKAGSISRVDFRFLKDQTPEEAGARVGIPYHLYDTVVFNPSSTKQCIERLWEFGWRPTEKTKGHIKAERERDHERLKYFKTYGYTVSEENLDTLPDTAPAAARLISRYVMLTRRLGTLSEWKAHYDEETKCIHGEVKSIGTWTHRASHVNPNTGNIARVTSEFGGEMRSLWNSNGGRQVGCDAEGIQLRILAHYMGDAEFTQALVAGRSEDGTDVHSLNLRKLGSACKDRTTAKTFIYSYILGASASKTAQIFGCSISEADDSRQKFVEAFPGLKRIRESLIPDDANRGYFIGLDGRPVMCDSRHLMLAGYLQNGESIVMKYAMWKAREQFKKEKIPAYLMNFVHDETQYRTINDKDIAEYIGQVQAFWIKQAGADLGVQCELAGSYKTGHNWKDTH